VAFQDRGGLPGWGLRGGIRQFELDEVAPHGLSPPNLEAEAYGVVRSLSPGRMIPMMSG